MPLKSAAEFVLCLELEEDDIDDVADEISTSIAAWNSSAIPNDTINVRVPSEEPILERLFKKLKM